MKVHIVTISFDKDLEWLKYCIQSVQKFCKGYTGHTIILNDIEGNCNETIKYLDSINYSYVVETESKAIENQYIGQQYRKFIADKFVPTDTDYVCHVDSDCIFFEEHTPEIYFTEGKTVPDMLITAYSNMNDKNVGAWAAPTEQFVGQPVEYEFMRRLPLLYAPSLMQNIREYVQTTFNKDLLSFLQTKKCFSEFNVFGAYAFVKQPHSFNWIDTHRDEWSNLPLLQMWSHDDLNQKCDLLQSLIQYPEIHLETKKQLRQMEETNTLPHGVAGPSRMDYRCSHLLQFRDAVKRGMM